MIAKCKKNINDYSYLLAFDLASHNTGIALWSIAEKKPIQTFLMVTKKADNFVYLLYENLKKIFQEIQESGVDLNKVLVCKEAMPSQLRGGSSTVQTFIALSKSHAILDLFLEQHNIDVYDYTGIYPATTHACLRKLLGVDSKTPVDKVDIKKYIKDVFDFDVTTCDESDAVFLAVTLINGKWNKDLEESIKEIKKHKKQLKMPKAILECDKEIEFLNSLLI